MNRRNFMKASTLGLAAFATAESGYIGWKFASPRIVEGEFGGEFEVGKVEDYLPGSVTPITNGRFYLVRQADGGLLAIYRQCTHLGCAVPWEPAEQRFVCPCHGSAFEMSGAVLNAPAPRPLDLFELRIEDGTIIVDTGKKIQRDLADDSFAIYAEVAS